MPLGCFSYRRRRILTSFGKDIKNRCLARTKYRILTSFGEDIKKRCLPPTKHKIQFKIPFLEFGSYQRKLFFPNFPKIMAVVPLIIYVS